MSAAGVFARFRRRWLSSSESVAECDAPSPMAVLDPVYDQLPADSARTPTLVSVVRRYASSVRDRGSPRALVVDDEAPVARFIERVLKDGGYSVTTAGGATAALQIMSEQPAFDIIVTDVRMPEITGPEFIDRARLRGPLGPVLYLTAHNDQLFKERLALADSEAFLNKPCTVAGLLEAVSLLLYGHIQPERSSPRRVAHE